MHTTIQPESSSRSRRALLAGALGGLGAWAAGAIGRASPTRAGVDGDVVLGGSNTTGGTTTIQNISGSANTMLFVSTSQGGTFFGVTDFADCITGFSQERTGVFGSGGESGVSGNSHDGHGVHGESANGWAGFFDGKVFTNQFLELAEIRNPTAPKSNRARLFIRERDGGTQLCVRFHNGVIRVLARA
ncbi:MAG TPA: hypothetical protein VF114_06735 [Candidatus Limnocylindria bacterium]